MLSILSRLEAKHSIIRQAGAILKSAGLILIHPRPVRHEKSQNTEVGIRIRSKNTTMLLSNTKIFETTTSVVPLFSPS